LSLRPFSQGLILAAALCSWTPGLLAVDGFLGNITSERIRIGVESPVSAGSLQFQLSGDDLERELEPLTRAGVVLESGQTLQLHVADGEIPAGGLNARLWLQSEAGGGPCYLLYRVAAGAEAAMNLTPIRGLDRTAALFMDPEGVEGAALFCLKALLELPESKAEPELQAPAGGCACVIL
jgi:hypothetical protein